MGFQAVSKRVAVKIRKTHVTFSTVLVDTKLRIFVPILQRLYVDDVHIFFIRLITFFAWEKTRIQHITTIV